MSEHLKLSNVSEEIDNSMFSIVYFLQKQGFEIIFEPNFELSPAMYALVNENKHSIRTPKYITPDEYFAISRNCKNINEAQSKISSTEFNWSLLKPPAKPAADVRKRIAEAARKDLFEYTNVSDIQQGIIVEINTKEVIVDIGHISYFDALELEDNTNLKVGDKIDVYCNIMPEIGYAPLSYKAASAHKKIHKSFFQIIDAYEKREILDGFIRCRTYEGFMVDLLGIHAFLPDCEIDSKQFPEELSIDTFLNFRIIKLDMGYLSFIVSNKAVFMDNRDESILYQYDHPRQSGENSYAKEKFEKWLNTYDEDDFRCPACGGSGGNCCNYSIDQL